MVSGMGMDLSIIIVSHGHRELIERYLPSVFNVSESIAIEAVFIDNLCTDGAAEWVSEKFPEITIVKNQIPRSYAENINIGIEKLQAGRYIVVLNPDIKCLPGLWEGLLEFMDNNMDVGISGPQLLNPDLTVQPSCRRFSTPLTLLIRGLHLDRFLRSYKPIHEYLMLDYNHKDLMDVDWVTGALMVVRREALQVVSGMDERYRIAYSEDQDWCCRMWRSGWRVSYVPEAKAVHDHLRTGMRKPWSRMARAQLINAIQMFRKFNWELSRK